MEEREMQLRIHVDLLEQRFGKKLIKSRFSILTVEPLWAAWLFHTLLER